MSHTPCDALPNQCWDRQMSLRNEHKMMEFLLLFFSAPRQIDLIRPSCIRTILHKRCCCLAHCFWPVCYCQRMFSFNCQFFIRDGSGSNLHVFHVYTVNFKLQGGVCLSEPVRCTVLSSVDFWQCISKLPNWVLVIALSTYKSIKTWCVKVQFICISEIKFWAIFKLIFLPHILHFDCLLAVFVCCEPFC